MKKDSGLNCEVFDGNDLVLVKKYKAKHLLKDFEIGTSVELVVGGPDMWVLATYGEKVECGWICNNEAHSELFSYQCLKIKESEL